MPTRSQPDGNSETPTQSQSLSLKLSPPEADADNQRDRGGRPIRVSFVCLGNICRSPTAEGIMRWLVKQERLQEHVLVESHGTGSWHLGEPADSRARATAASRGVTLNGRAQQFSEADFDRLDYILVMDTGIRDALSRLAPSDEAREKLHLLRAFDPDSPPGAPVPDPYYGGADGFEEVYDICEAACRGFLRYLRDTHRLPDDRPADTRP